MKVYVVTIGDYSDYRIYGVYSTREKAKEVVEKYSKYNPYESIRIEEYELDSRDVHVEVYVAMDIHGNYVYEDVTTVDKPYFDVYFSVEGYLVMVATDIDLEKAKKKLADIRTLALNEGIWGDTEKLRELLKGGAYV